MKKLLFVDSCISMNQYSRTRVLCDAFLKSLSERDNSITVEAFKATPETVYSFTKEKLEYRNACSDSGDFSNPMFDMAKQLISADYVLVGAPYWDLSFPSVLKTYIEDIVVRNLTFSSDIDGLHGLCRAKKLLYLSAVGGYIPDGRHLGYEYVKAVAGMIGIPDSMCIYAEGLDIFGNDVKSIMNAAVTKAEKDAVDWMLK